MYVDSLSPQWKGFHMKARHWVVKKCLLFVNQLYPVWSTKQWQKSRSSHLSQAQEQRTQWQAGTHLFHDRPFAGFASASGIYLLQWLSVCSIIRKLENQLRKMCKLILVSSYWMHMIHLMLTSQWLQTGMLDHMVMSGLDLQSMLMPNLFVTEPQRGTTELTRRS